MRAIEQLTPRALSRNTRESAAHFLGSLCDSKHLPSAYCTTLILILSPDHLQITSQLPSHATAITNAQREKRQLSLRLRTPQMVALRPRRRGRLLRQSLPNEVNKERVDSKLGPWDSCTGYCHEHRLPNNLSDRVKRRLYLVASQTHWDRQPHVAALVRSRDVEARVQQRPVTQPDTAVLNWVIDSLSMDLRRPVPGTMACKSRGFSGFPFVCTQKLALAQILRLCVRVAAC